jgi:hypothetical protein
MTPEQEKAALDRLRPLQRWVASPGPSFCLAAASGHAAAPPGGRERTSARRQSAVRVLGLLLLLITIY